MNLKFLRWKPSRLNAFRWLCDYCKAPELRKGERTHEKSIFLSSPPTQFIFYFTVFKCLVTHLNWGFHSLKTEWKKPSFLLIARFLRTLTQISKERQKKKKSEARIGRNLERQRYDDNRVPTSPDDRTLFIYSKNDSSLISLSVKMKVTPLPCWPAVRYRPFRSSIRLAVL